MLSNIKHINSQKATSHSQERKANSQSGCSIREATRTESKASFISYKKDKYSYKRLSVLLSKSPNRLNVLGDISNCKSKNNLLAQFNDVEISPMKTLQISEGDKAEQKSASRTSERENCDRETAENNDMSAYLYELSGHSSSISDSYKSLSTIVNERSRGTTGREDLWQPTVTIKNPFQ